MSSAYHVAWAGPGQGRWVGGPTLDQPGQRFKSPPAHSQLAPHRHLLRLWTFLGKQRRRTRRPHNLWAARLRKRTFSNEFIDFTPTESFSLSCREPGSSPTGELHTRLSPNGTLPQGATLLGSRSQFQSQVKLWLLKHDF